MIVITYGNDLVKNTYDTLAASDIASYLDAGMEVSLKPNLVVPGPASNGAITHPEVIEGIILFLRDFGVREIAVIENSAIGRGAARAFKACGYEPLRKKHGVSLIELRNDPCQTLRHDGGGSRESYDVRICGTALKADFLINAPVLKGHSQTLLTCCMKNLKGCIPHAEMKRFHELGLHGPIAALNALLKTDYCVVDGICGDLSFEEGGSPVEANRVIAGRNPVLVDSFCAALIGYAPEEIGYLSLGREMGLGEFYSSETKTVELNADDKPRGRAKGALIADRHRGLVDEDAACSVCLAALTFALRRLGERGRLPRGGKIGIGQGFRGKSGEGLGVGNCARGFANCVPGCPPRAVDVMAFLDGAPLSQGK